MPTLLEQIKLDSKAARLAGNTRESSILSTVIGECQTKEKQANPARVLRDEEVAAVVRKFLKGVDETLAFMKGKAGMEARQAEFMAERDMLLRYLPTMMDEPALEAFIRERIAQGASSVGVIMKALTEQHAGAYDGRLASTVAARCLKG